MKVDPSTLDNFIVSAGDQAIRGWKASALAGAENAIRELRARGLVEIPLAVDVTEFIGIPTDTSDADASLATFMAVLSAFPELQPPKLELSADGCEWVLRWPP